MLAPSIPAGGHISHGKKEHSGTAGLVHGLEIEFYPFDAEEMTIDVDKTKQKVKDLKKTTVFQRWQCLEVHYSCSHIQSKNYLIF